MTTARLLATDLDRTLIPNGVQPESPRVRDLLFAFVERCDVTLVYVTGRRLALVEEAITEHGLAPPGYVIGDVGSSIWVDRDGEWSPLTHWVERLERDWPSVRGPVLAARLADDPQLTAQEPEAQAPFKASFYSDLAADRQALRARLVEQLDAVGARSVIVQSVDEAKGVGLVDVLPAASSKLHALAFLARELGVCPDQVLFAGDSGNDLEVLASPIPSVLVANAAQEVREAARQLAARADTVAALHIARGGVLGANGNYAAGILEGWLHFHPTDRAAIEELARHISGGCG